MAERRYVPAPHAPHAGLRPSPGRHDTRPGERAGYLAAVFESARDGLLVLDDDRVCVDVNRAGCDLLGVARGGLVGRRFDTFAPTGWRERVISGWDVFVRDGSATGEFEFAAQDGLRALVEFTAHARAAGVHHLWVLRDITASREAEVARGNFAALLDRTEDAIYMCSHDGVLLSWNRGARELYGYTAEEAIGQSVAMLLPPAQRGVRQETWERALGGESVEHFETVRLTKDGTSVVVAVTVTALTDEFGTATGVGEIARDVTEQKYAQAAPLSAAQVKAVESSQLQTQFIASMNHELRVPLNGVIGITRLLEDTKLDAEQREYVQGLRVAGEGVASAIEAVLDFSKLETGTLELSDEPYDLRALVEDVCSVVSLGAANEVEVLSCVEPDIPAVLHGDEQHVRQVLATLVGNAVKLTPAGDVCVSARVGTGDGAPHAQVDIVTGGVGIDHGEQQSVFDSFTPAAGMTSRGPGNAGFGVMIAKRLVSMMGGEVGVEIIAGQGSTFSFTLPLRSDPGDPATPPQTELDGERILVIDANASGRELVVRQLEGWNARVATASDHAAALMALRAAAHADEPFAVALIDYRDRDRRTSQLDAAELARSIRDDPRLRRTRTVLLVAPRDSHAVSRATQPDALILKPVGQTRLYGELTRVIGIAPPEPGEATPPPEPAKQDGNVGHVLVAEDNPVNQLVAVRLLEQRGFLVDVANDGREAIVMHAHNVYDAIFMDVQMPEIGGYEATREIRRREGTKRHTPIIAMTASTLPSDRDRCLAEGMDHHTGKPVRPSALDHIIARAIPARST